MACPTCTGVTLCDLTQTECIQLVNSEGSCDGIAEGYSRIFFNEDGMTICTNVAGVGCSCQDLPTLEDVWIDNGDGTITHISNLGTVVTIDICNSILPNCIIGNLGNVATGGNEGDVFVLTGGIWTPTARTQSTIVDNGDGTFTHTGGLGAVTTLDVCALIADGGCTDTLVYNNDGTYTHTALDGTQTIINVCDAIGDGGCTDTLVNNNDGTYTHTALNGVVVTIDICNAITQGGCTDSLVDNGDSTYTHTAVDGTVQVIDICGDVAANCNSALVDNNDGTWTFTDNAGAQNVLTLPVGATDTLVNNGDSTYTHTAVDGVVTIIDICGDVAANCNSTLVNNGDGTFTHTTNAGVQTIIDVCALIAAGGCTDVLVNNNDGTMTHTALDGVAVIIDPCQLLIDSNCTGGVNVTEQIPNTIINVAAPVAQWTVVDVTCETLTNTTDSPMRLNISADGMSATLLNLDNNDHDFGLRTEVSFDGVNWIDRNLWAASEIPLARTGQVGDRANINLGSHDFQGELPAGQTLTFCVRRSYSTTSPNAIVELEAIDIRLQGIAYPY